MSKSSKILIAVIIVLLVILVGYRMKQKAQAPQSSTIKIGGAFALSGDAAAWGEAEKNAVTLAMEEMEKKQDPKYPKVEVVVEDTKSDNSKEVSAVSKLINIDKVNVMLGPTWLDTYGGATPLSDQYKTLMFTPSAAITAVKGDKAYPYVFSTWYAGDLEGRELVRHAAKMGKKRVALFFENDSYWQDISARVHKYAPEYSVEIVEELKSPPTETDFRTSLLKIKDLKVDAILFGINGDRRYWNFLKQRRELFPEVSLFTTGALEEFMTQKKFEGLFDGVYMVVPKIKDTTFVERYKTRFGVDPVFSASNAYDAANILMEAFGNGSRSPEDVGKYFKEHTFNTVTFGTTSFDEFGGLKNGEFGLKALRDGKAEFVK